MKLLGWIVCKVKGKHLRGKPFSPEPVAIARTGAFAAGITVQHYRCPRCGETWWRKRKDSNASK